MKRGEKNSEDGFPFIQFKHGPCRDVYYRRVMYVRPLRFKSIRGCDPAQMWVLLHVLSGSATGAGWTLKSVLAFRIFTMYFVDEHTSAHDVERQIRSARAESDLQFQFETMRNDYFMVLISLPTFFELRFEPFTNPGYWAGTKSETLEDRTDVSTSSKLTPVCSRVHILAAPPCSHPPSTWVKPHTTPYRSQSSILLITSSYSDFPPSSSRKPTIRL